MNTNGNISATAQFRVRVPKLIDAHYGAASTVGLSIDKILTRKSYQTLVIPMSVVLCDGYLLELAEAEKSSMSGFNRHSAISETISRTFLFILHPDFGRRDFSIKLDTVEFLASEKCEIAVYFY